MRSVARARPASMLLLAWSACSTAQDPPAEVGTLWAGGGFACLQRSGFDCRLLDYFIADRGQAALPDVPLRHVSFGMNHTCYVTEDGSGACVGDDTNHTSDVPGGTWTMIEGSGGQACGLRVDGTVECWGNGAFSTPPGGVFVDVQPMDGAACARDGAGSITCWGNDYAGNVTSPEGSWASFILPSSYLCMLDLEGSIACAGWEIVADAAIPTGTGYQSLTGGFNFACALDVEGHAACWGVDAYGMLDAPADQTFVQIASGDYFTCGLTPGGEVTCWGCRDEGSSHPERYCNWEDPAPWWDPG